jgi:hypothetical protein
MSDRLRKTVFLVLPAVLVFAGCVRHHEKDADVLARGPDVERVTVGSDYGKLDKEGISVPARIEIFGGGAPGDSQERLVKIDCCGFGAS